MGNFILGVIVAVLIFLGIGMCTNHNEEKAAAQAAPTALPSPVRRSKITISEPAEVRDDFEIIARDIHPFDNRAGKTEIAFVKKLTRTAANECTFSNGGEVAKEFQVNWSPIEAQIGRKVSDSVGRMIGEKCEYSEEYKFVVPAHTAVTFEVQWLRNKRFGKCAVLSGEKEVQVPFIIRYGLWCKIVTRDE